MKKRVFALMLVLCLVFAMLPVPAFAEGEVTEPQTVVPEEEKNPEEPVVPEETKKSEEPVVPEKGKNPEEPLTPAEPTAVQKVQALIDALPETVTAENRAEVEAQLTAIDDAKVSLGDDELAALDFGKYNGAVAAINVLDNQPGAEVPKTMEDNSLTVTMAGWNVDTGPNMPAVTGLPDKPDNYKVTYTKRDGTVLDEVPTEIGEYQVTVSCVDSKGNTYSGTANFSVFLSVSFDPNGDGATLEEANCTIQTTTGKLSTLPEPTWTGHTFQGWYTHAAEGNQVHEETIYTENTTLYARWKTHTYTIAFDANGGEGEMDPLSMTYGEEANLTANGFTWTGYTFTGWNTQADDKGSTSFDDEASVSNLSTVDGDKVTLYAQWIKVIDRVDLSLSGHKLDEKVEGVKVTTKDDISFSLDNYGDDWGITMDSNNLTTLSGKLFLADTQYYLWVKFSAKEGCTLKGLKKENVFLDGKAALSLTDDDQGAVTAVFRLPVIYTIETSTGKNGTIDPEGTVAVFEGQDAEIKITPNSGYVVYRLTVDGINVKTARTYTFKNVQESHTIHARFLKNGSNAKTGDSFPMGIALGIVTLSAAALAALFFLRKRKRVG